MTPKNKKRLETVLAEIMIIASLALALYIGGYLFFWQGMTAIVSGPMTVPNMAFNLFRIVFSIPVFFLVVVSELNFCIFIEHNIIRRFTR